ncbi:hypothetical protein AB0903_14020 [Streptomyces sp. NPDC048389]|uniref:hypothetical protein n=1 Tax=Streptomyces sp. NPDC048389 TaxID=3154622 RepID=UPI00345542FD
MPYCSGNGARDRGILGAGGRGRAGPVSSNRSVRVSRSPVPLAVRPVGAGPQPGRPAAADPVQRPPGLRGQPGAAPYEAEGAANRFAAEPVQARPWAGRTRLTAGVNSGSMNGLAGVPVEARISRHASVRAATGSPGVTTLMRTPLDSAPRSPP